MWRADAPKKKPSCPVGGLSPPSPLIDPSAKIPERASLNAARTFGAGRRSQGKAETTWRLSMPGAVASSARCSFLVSTVP